MDTDEKKQEEAQKELIIEQNIAIPIERLGGVLSAERQSGLRKMTLLELKQLAIDLQDSETSTDAISTVVRAIAASQQARREDDTKRLDGLIGPAHVDMDPK